MDPDGDVDVNGKDVLPSCCLVDWSMALWHVSGT
jgi:hypothetical protein